MDDGQYPATDIFRRIFAGIGEGQRLFSTEADTGDEPAEDEERHGRCEGAEDCEDAEQQQVELIDKAASETIAELSLTRGTDEQAEDGGAADQRDFRPGRELGLKDERDE